MVNDSAIPTFYYVVFGVFEPLLTLTGFFGAIANPKKTHDSQAPWPVDHPPPDILPLATQVTIIQLGHVCALVGLVNAFVLSALRKHLAKQPAVQEKIVRALLTPLLIGDLLHVGITLWALGDDKWDFASWGIMLWTTVLLGISLLVPRVAWHFGIARYVHSRDGPSEARKQA